MGERLKDMFFTKDSILKMVSNIREVFQEFNEEKFFKDLYSDQWDALELKGRMRRVTLCLKGTLPDDFKEAVDILKKTAPAIKGFEAMSLPDYVEVYGLNDWEISMEAMRHFTRFSSSEFAIRPFLDLDPQRGMAFLLKCAKDPDDKIRRWASEGCRPRLPWAMALSGFKKDPALIFEVLEELKTDPSEDVRRSVANNLNDISKDNSDLVLDKCEKWFGKNKETDWIIKHACRTLLKAGNKRALVLFGYCNPEKILMSTLRVKEKSVKMGDKVEFTFEMTVEGNQKSKIRLEYGIDYMKANGKNSKKIFKITENNYKPGKYEFKRVQSFKNMTTRKHYPGKHGLSIIINGQEKGSLEFLLTP